MTRVVHPLRQYKSQSVDCLGISAQFRCSIQRVQSTSYCYWTQFKYAEQTKFKEPIICQPFVRCFVRLRDYYCCCFYDTNCDQEEKLIHFQRSSYCRFQLSLQMMYLHLASFEIYHQLYGLHHHPQKHFLYTD